ncbi:hypothetical protein [Bacillus cereus]
MIETKWLITNGNPTIETLQGYANKGYRFIATRNADEYHPYALEGDKISFFAKYKRNSVIHKEANL